ncbi:hypothetical protein KRM28CT15_56400 [Krasilnikovia sp. M28-CT-15]
MSCLTTQAPRGRANPAFGRISAPAPRDRQAVRRHDVAQTKHARWATGSHIAANAPDVPMPCRETGAGDGNRSSSAVAGASPHWEPKWIFAGASPIAPDW